ncbi:hypothetical protein Q8W71_28080 [Methylobacterium sp. NEAU 140]|uniref:hypothetical protein n=1 Tax=Methylobacterium sp. NEAU 140 TaxID=3064945 RepID=UPI002732AA09|nr:hypothetical protein [Methylobacterium sp. NEAU 140]MDP4026483.1 hypothetical protein [Methylobacterium sp. NEAU 140]
MAALPTEVIDCDVHPAAPDMKQILPYLDDYWRDMVVTRGTDGLDLNCYPPNVPLSARDDWRLSKGKPGSDLGRMRTDLLDRFNTRFAICNCLHGAAGLFNADHGAALARAVSLGEGRDPCQRHRARLDRHRADPAPS